MAKTSYNQPIQPNELGKLRTILKVLLHVIGYIVDNHGLTKSFIINPFKV